MRLIVINQDHDLQTLSRKLFGSGSKSSDEAVVGNATFERIKLLNPHVDFQHIEVGTVLLLPDRPELNDSESQSIAGDTFADFTGHVTMGFKTVTQRVQTSAEALAADRTAVTNVLKTTTVKQQIESDPLLKKQLDEASDEFAAELKQAQNAAKQVDAMQKSVAEELRAIAELLP